MIALPVTFAGARVVAPWVPVTSPASAPVKFVALPAVVAVVAVAALAAVVALAAAPATKA